MVPKRSLPWTERSSGIWRLYSSTLIMEAACSSEASVNIYQTTWRHIPWGSNVRITAVTISVLTRKSDIKSYPGTTETSSHHTSPKSILYSLRHKVFSFLVARLKAQFTKSRLDMFCEYRYIHLIFSDNYLTNRRCIHRHACQQGEGKSDIPLPPKFLQKSKFKRRRKYAKY